MKSMLLGAALLASTVSTLSFADAGPVYSTLSVHRAQITFPAYTPEEKQLVAEGTPMVAFLEGQLALALRRRERQRTAPLTGKSAR